jgi:hypothetical protein
MKTVNCVFILMLIVLLNNVESFAQYDEYLCGNDEKLIFGFKTKSKKLVSICVSKNDKYIVYRFGTKNKIELEYPENKQNSWKLFRYDFYFRGGGKDNAGLDLNYLSFINDNIKYRIYHEYSAEDGKVITGVRVIDLNNKKVVDIPGLLNTIKGSLVDFRFDYQGKITTGDDLKD